MATNDQAGRSVKHAVENAHPRAGSRLESETYLRLRVNVRCPFLAHLRHRSDLELVQMMAKQIGDTGAQWTL